MANPDIDDGWRSPARSLANRPAGQIKRVIGVGSLDDAVATFALPGVRRDTGKLQTG
jgi:hypothetical protein